MFPSNVSVRSHDKPNRLFYFASLYRELYREVRSEEVDVYQHANLGFREFNPAVLLPPDMDTPFLIGPAEGGHAVPSAEFKRVLARQIDRDVPSILEAFAPRAAEPVVRNGLDPIRERLFGATLERADRIVAVHSNAKERFEQYTDAEKIDVIPYGVDMEKFPFRAAPGNQSFVTVGNLIERKGHRFLLDAMTTVTEEFPDAELHVVGTGPLREDLEARVATAGLEDSVTFHGFVEDEKLLRLLHRARAFVHSSLSEGFSHVRLEAMSAGCPVIGTDVSGARDLTRHGTDGYIVPTGDADALADSMLELLADDKLAEEIGRNAREKIERDHDYEKIGKQYLEIYRRLAD
ncbi:glycosyltransferase family 4 protein [Natrinema sp. DC36]|uniref:glycosyltransferase family 4 protein n=1 Tax=Natrinema sp. DC36 TaxID=2878680 RepID=UPI0031F30271